MHARAITITTTATIIRLSKRWPQGEVGKAVSGGEDGRSLREDIQKQIRETMAAIQGGRRKSSGIAAKARKESESASPSRDGCG